MATDNMDINRSSNPFEPLRKVKSASDYELRNSGPSPVFGIQSNDIKIEIMHSPVKKSATPSQPQSHLLQANREVLFRSPIKEENEEDETSHHGTPSQSMLHGEKRNLIAMSNDKNTNPSSDIPKTKGKIY